MSEAEEIIIIYDGECPFCSNYVRLVELRKTIKSVKLIDARSGDDPFLKDVIEQGFDLDEGMVAYFDKTYFHGADCIHLLAMLSTSNTFFNRFNRLIFTHRTLSKFLYPFMRFCRNLTLRILGRSKLDLNH